MEVATDSIRVSSGGRSQVIDITPEIAALLEKHRFSEGHVLVFVPGSTAALTTVEFEPGLQEDLPELFERLAPSDARYHHDDTWHDGNGHSHVRASLVGPSVTIPFRAGRLLLGTWQQVVVLDFDNRPRTRDVVCQFLGSRQS